MILTICQTPRVHRHGDMFMRDQPFIPYFTIAIGNTHCPVDRMTLHISAPDTLEAVTKSNMAIRGDVKISDGYFRRAPEM